MANPYNVLLVDDSAVVRSVFKRILNDPEINIVDAVGDGKAALDVVKKCDDIDVVVLDIEMPIMDGMTVLPKLLEARPGINIVMASTLTRRNAEITIKALDMGAKDYIPKPTSNQELREAEDFQKLLLLKVKTLGAQKRRKRPFPSQKEIDAAQKSTNTSFSLRKKSAALTGKIDVIAVGSSTGGPAALVDFFKGLPKNLKKPILVTQHMPPTFTTILAENITKNTGFKCVELKDGQAIEPGVVHLAPGDYHLTLEADKRNIKAVLNQDPPENFCRPAVDVMLRSVADIYGGNTLVVMLTGMGQDGLLGAKKIADKGGIIIAQDEETSIVWGMPGAVAQAGICTAVLPLQEIPGYVQQQFFRFIAA